MRGLFLLAATAAAAALAAGLAKAATVEFSIAGLCATDCAAVGAFGGDFAGGSVTLDATGFAPGAAIDAAAFLDVSFIFGDVELTRSTAPSFGATGLWGATPDDPGIGLRIAMGPAAPLAGDALSLSVNMPGAASRFLATLDGVCAAGSSSPCASIAVGPRGAALAPDPRVRAVPTPVPVPSALALIVAGLAALGLAGLRSGRDQAASAGWNRP